MKLLSFRKNVVLKFLLPLVMIFSSGCVYLVIGGLGALGGYVASPDTVEGTTSRDQTEVWDTAHEILSIMGVIDEHSEGAGSIVAIVNGSRVTVTVMPVGVNTIKMSVKARKAALFPTIGIAQDVYIKIMSTLNE